MSSLSYRLSNISRRGMMRGLCVGLSAASVPWWLLDGSVSRARASEFYAIPGSPDPLDEEYTTSSVPPGWGMWSENANAFVAAAGTPTWNVSPAANTYNIEINRRPSWASFQISTGRFYWCETISPATDAVFRARFAGHSMMSNGNPDNYGTVQLALAADSSGLPDATFAAGDLLAVGWDSDAGTMAPQFNKYVGGVYTDVRTAGDVDQGFAGDGEFVLIKVGITYHAYYRTATMNHYMGSTSFPSTVGWWGIYLTCTAGGTPARPILHCDYTRYEATSNPVI